MKQTLSPDSRQELILYRLNRASETLEEAAYIARGNYYHAAVKRLYYACYYASSALMLSNHVESSTHAGIKTMLGLKFIKPGLIPMKYGRIYQQLFENRQSGDYEDFVYCDKEMYGELEPLAIDFVSYMKDYILKE